MNPRSRQPKGTPVGGQYATEEKAEPGVVLANPPRPPRPPRIVSTTEHELAHRGIVTATLDNGKVVAHNTSGDTVACPVCRGERAKQATCSECFGRGRVDNIPFCERPWDQVTPGLFLGGHDCQPENGDCKVTDQFDVVVSLYTRDGWGPDEGVAHHTHTMIDGPLDPADHEHIDRLADAVVEALDNKQTVLVRCQAGMNRSGLVAGLAMMRLGWTAADAIDHMRAVRGPYVLFNDDFTNHLRNVEHQARSGRVRCTECAGHREFFGVTCPTCDGVGWTCD